MNTPNDIWPEMNEHSALLLYLMNWRPHPQAAHASCNYRNAGDEVPSENDIPAWSSLNLPPSGLRECAKALEDAANWLEKRASHKAQG